MAIALTSTIPMSNNHSSTTSSSPHNLPQPINFNNLIPQLPCSEQAQAQPQGQPYPILSMSSHQISQQPHTFLSPQSLPLFESSLYATTPTSQDPAALVLPSQLPSVSPVPPPAPAAAAPTPIPTPPLSESQSPTIFLTAPSPFGSTPPVSVSLPGSSSLGAAGGSGGGSGSGGSSGGAGGASDSDPSLRSALVLRALEQNARALAEADHEALQARRASPPPRDPAERRRRVRNKSAFVSRQSRRHYAQLLAKHVETIETQRNQAALECHSVSQQIHELQIALQHLQSSQSQPRPQNQHQHSSLF